MTLTMSSLPCKIAVEPLMSHGLFCVGSVAVYGGSESFWISSKNILTCVPKMNECLTGLKRHEGE